MCKGMIKSFRHKGLRKLFEKDEIKSVPSQFADKIKRRLDAIYAAKEITDLNLPGFKLHELEGKRKGTWSVWITGNWRVTFRFEAGDASEVDYEDYH